jgi:hypothetical protein
MTATVIFEIGTEVVRSKGDYVVGRVGVIVEIDEVKNRAQVAWGGNPKTWVSLNAIMPTSIPYEIVKVDGSHPKYMPK